MCLEHQHGGYLRESHLQRNLIIEPTTESIEMVNVMNMLLSDHDSGEQTVIATAQAIEHTCTLDNE